MKQKALICVALLVLAAGAMACSGRNLSMSLPPTPTPTAPPRVAFSTAQRLEMLDTVWQIVDDNYFDPAFGGLDWQAVGQRYRPLVAEAQDDEAFVRVLNEMLFELGVSHIGVLPQQMVEQMDPVSSAAGSVGMDVRLVDGQAVIVSVQPGSPTDQAGLRPGHIIEAVDGQTLSEIAGEAWYTPPDNERNRIATATQAMRGRILGEPGQRIMLTYLDEDDERQEVYLTMASREGRMESALEVLPAFNLDVEARRLEGGYGYLRFSGFLEPLLEEILDAIDAMADAPALIIDLRGNPGGVFPVRKALAEKLVGERVLFWRYQRRDGLERAYLDPVADPYRGRLVILIDELSASSAEEFAGGMQAIERAILVGQQSPGRCLVADVKQLPSGAILVYPTGQSQTTSGRVLEDNGVVPDIEVPLDREALLQGIDPQLQEAVRAAQLPIQPLPVPAGDVTLHARVAGKPESGRVLVAVNGGPGLSSHYMLSLEQLAGPAMAVVTYDQRGMGRSTTPGPQPANFELADYVADLDAVRRAVGADQIDLLGHSWGGLVATAYAATYPDRVHSLVLMGSGPVAWAEAQQCMAAIGQRAEALIEAGIIDPDPGPGTLESERGILPAYFSDARFWFTGTEGRHLEYSQTVNDLTWAAVGDYDLSEEISTLSMPVLFLWGEDDPCSPILEDTLRGAWSSAGPEHHVLEQCGHFWQECPGQFYPLVREFLGLE